MTIAHLHHDNTNVFGIKITGKLTTEEIEAFLPELEKAAKAAPGRLRLLLDLTEMHGADMKSEWETFEFLKDHIHDIQLIAIVGAHAWEKIMSEIVTGSIFVEAPTFYFAADHLENAWQFLIKAPAPRHIPKQRYVDSNKGLFTKHGSPNYL